MLQVTIAEVSVRFWTTAIGVGVAAVAVVVVVLFLFGRKPE
jgi:hypothetical protein